MNRSYRYNLQYRVRGYFEFLHIEENVQPCKTALETRSCTEVNNGDTLALYVLELADGYVQKFKVTSDSVLEIISI